MLLPIVLGVQIFLTMTFTPNDQINHGNMEENASVMKSPVQPTIEDLSTMMRRYVAYNHWANQQMAEWLSLASEEDLIREIESSYSTIKETIFHIWGAEYLWLQVVKGEDYSNSPVKDFKGSKEELFEGWLKASQRFSDHVKTMSLEDLQEQRPRSNGEGYTLIADMIHHCMNHSTYHRGQLITMGRQAGLTDAPRTDFIYYVGLSGE